MEFIIKIIIQMVAIFTLGVFWEIDLDKIGFPKFMLGWVLAATLLQSVDSIINTIIN